MTGNAMHRFLVAVLCLVLAGAAPALTLTGQILAYQDGFVFFTTGDGFRVAPNVAIADDVTKKPTSLVPRPRIYARATFDDRGNVTELDLTKSPLPIQALTDATARFAITASPRYANPELAATPSAGTLPGGLSRTFSGRPVLVTITVQVPPTTPLTSTIYITTDASAWNPQAIQMDRIDALHFRVTRRIASGTILNYLYTRGSLQSEERAENGLERQPRQTIINDADVRAINDVVYQWADSASGGQQSQPSVIPTPYNPAPFPNLPTPHPR